MDNYAKNKKWSKTLLDSSNFDDFRTIQILYQYNLKLAFYPMDGLMHGQTEKQMSNGRTNDRTALGVFGDRPFNIFPRVISLQIVENIVFFIDPKK